MRKPAVLGLRRTQELIWELIAAPEGVEKGMAALKQEEGVTAEDLSHLIRGDDRLSPVRRLDIYASMYFYRLHDCLVDDFPRVARVLGGANFHNLVTDYLLEHPSSHWSLRYLGTPFASYLASHALGEEFPFVADLARLEWTRIEVFDAKDVTPLGREAVASLSPEVAGSWRLSLVPACQLLRTQWSVAPMWSRLQEEESVPDGDTHSAAVSSANDGGFASPATVERPEETAGCLVVWRSPRGILHRSLGPAEYGCLNAVSRTGGATLSELGQVILEADGGETGSSQDQVPESAGVQKATRHLTELMGRWLTDGLLQGADKQP